MLYQIKCYRSRFPLEWIVNLQRRIVIALCQANVGSQTVTPDWIAAHVEDADPDWLAKLLTKRDAIKASGKTLLEDMRLIAGLDGDVKNRLLAAFENDQRLTDVYLDGADIPVVGLRDLEERAPIAAAAVRSFFEIFYNPAFYRQFGYEIPKPDGTTLHFDRDTFVQEFLQENNNLSVCPFCDGDLGSAQVDHFFPKAKFPFLACHPLNLVPICSTCNSRTCKGEKTPLDPDAPRPAENWLHPYLRPAAQAYEIKLVRPTGGTLTAALFHEDQLQQRRLDNFSSLVNLQSTWTAALSRRVHATQRKIDGHRKRTGKHSLDTKELLKKLSEWADNDEDEIGVLPFSIVGSTYLRSAASQDPLTWDELWIYNTTIAQRNEAGCQ